MRRTALVVFFILLLAFVAACSPRGLETQSTIVRKEIKDGNQYYFYVTYEAVIDGIPGTFEASIKLPGRAEYERYNMGDKYVFWRPAPK